MKGVFVVVVFILVMGLFAFARSNLERAKRELKRLRDEVVGTNNYKKSDILFLLDSSRSLSSSEFEIEKGFVMNFLNTITVSMEDTRIEVISFAYSASRYVDGVSVPSSDKHKCQLVEKFKSLHQGINGNGGNTYGAFKLAYDVCIGKLSRNKRTPYFLVRTVVILLTAGPWKGQSPVSIAKDLPQAYIEVYVIGVRSSFLEYNLRTMVNNADKQAFYFRNFQEFHELSLFLRKGKSTEVYIFTYFSTYLKYNVTLSLGQSVINCPLYYSKTVTGYNYRLFCFISFRPVWYNVAKRRPQYMQT